MAPKKKGAKKEEEPKKEEVKEEPKKEEKKVEPKKDEPKKDEPKKEEPKEEPKKEEAKEEPKADVEMKDEPEAPKEPEKPKELEVDAVADKRPKIGASAFEFSSVDSTLNVMPTAGGKLLMSLADDGLQYFLACSRASAGVKSGRYMFEFKILEMLQPLDAGKVRLNGHKQLARVGFSTAGSSLFLSGNPDGISFDSEGFYSADKGRTKPARKFSKGQTVAVLLNLDPASPNADTISIFINGVRACEPQKLPEGLKGKALYPTVNYRNVTLQVNLGPVPLEPLPFSCHMLTDAAKPDTEASSTAVPKQCQVMFPVGLPGQGVSDFVEDFVEKNAGYDELSDRKILEWAQNSGVQQPKIEDFSVQRIVQAVAPFLKRNYVNVNLKSNLIPSEREQALKKFPGFKKVACVIMGEPSAEYKEKVKSLLLAAKTKQKEAEFKRKLAAEASKKAAAERAKKAEAAKKARIAAAAAKKNGDAAPEEKAEEKEEEEEKPAEEEIKMDPVELSEEELKLWYRPSTASEVPSSVLAKVFTKFALPEKSEGFDDIKYLWQPMDKAAAHLKDYVLERKLTERVDDLKPGEWFQSQFKEYQTLFAACKKRQTDWKNPALKKKLLAEIAAAKKKAEGGDEAKEGEEKKEEEPSEPMKIDAEDLNPLEVEDVMDIGSGEPLFVNFAFEDWTMVSLRTELHLLVHAFKKDMDDPERSGFHQSHAGFYFQKYMKKALDPKNYGKSDMSELVKLMPEICSINSMGVFEGLLPEDTPLSQFVKLSEEHRRERQRRVDAGDETAELKFVKAAPQQPQGRPPYQNAQKRPAPGGQQSWQANKHAKISPYQPVGFRR